MQNLVIKIENIKTKNQEVRVNQNYLYTAYRFLEFGYDIKNESCKFIVKILSIKSKEAAFEFDCQIVEILRNKEQEAKLEDEFNFGINKTTNDTAWRLEDIKTGLIIPELYEYIGPKRILDKVRDEYVGDKIFHQSDIDKWISKSNQKIPKNKIVIATYIIDKDGILILADRHSEHVQCANKEKVLSAGEIGFEMEQNKVSGISFVSNQSTGYCPSSKSWGEVEKALKKIGEMEIPNQFDPAFKFSYCVNCESLKVIKEEFYYCYGCKNDLFTDTEFQKRRLYLK